ncbi:hypothetical protein [Bifidobacterium stellenboschense]|uniref:Uncharacterized protein n=1 Tax=Bifidobacterium stellenboschense TaxID=762211 RepID=A0A087DMV0_9BIFI|nr:hypothetical protein [Bifidobacterium stellenboschense]KFI96850.1 hypothetical protein BSTEL_1759 [Bifidobacterium stellenboschense]
MAVFEDDFMDIQAGLVALALEAVGDANVEDVYIYGSIEGCMTAFNVFFRVDGEVRYLRDVVDDQSIRLQVLELGTGDLGKLRDLCFANDHDCPTQIRGRYHAASGGYRAHYAYDPIVCDEQHGIAPSEAFVMWVDDVRAGRDDLATDNAAGIGED